MLFGSSVFLFLFLPAVLLGHLVLPRGLRNAFLLLASLLFYAWGEPAFVLVMLGSIAGNFLLGRALESRRGGSAERWIVAATVTFNLGLLIAFKYANFLWDNLTSLGARAGLELAPIEPIALPLGISFFTFQAMSYVLDVRRGEAPAQRNPIDFGLFIAMFPQLIAGPIVRYRDIARQLIERTVSRTSFASGARRFVFGLGKKLLVADVVAWSADRIFDLPTGELSTSNAWLGIVCYTLQIYFDFSAYSDMAIGLGRMLGFQFLENFDHPYASHSITEFWRRWHISLSSWFRDYLYIPLGGNRGSPAKTYRNLILVFFLCGLWHGASWTFVIWGLFHGSFLVLERLGASRLLGRIPRTASLLYTLLVVMVGWVFFRSETLAGALGYLAAMAGSGSTAGLHPTVLFADPLVMTAIVVGVVGSAPIWPAVSRWREARLVATDARGKDNLLELGQTLAFCLVLLLSLMQLSAGTYSPFIYFRF